MAVVTIEDLPQSDALDHEAMRLIIGGSATGARPNAAHEPASGNGCLVAYPPGFGSHSSIPPRGRRLVE
jgi:hypothetical protein